jgi:fluoroacetyl-CoA thioesterase
LPFSTEQRSRLIGAVGHASLHVDAVDTAIAVGSGDVPVLGTPRMIALMETAACEALRGSLNPGQTSVGAHVDVRHMRPSPIGAQVAARACITGVDGDRITFEVEARHSGDPGVVIGSGTHTRVIVERERFIQQVDR